MTRPNVTPKESALAIVGADADWLRQLEERLPRSIQTARDAGATLREIGQAAGMSPEGVRKLIARQ